LAAVAQRIQSNQTILWYNGVKSLVTLYYVTLNGPWPGTGNFQF